jgi:hypothetical protein
MDGTVLPNSLADEERHYEENNIRAESNAGTRN